MALINCPKCNKEISDTVKLVPTVDISYRKQKGINLHMEKGKE